MNNSRRQYDIVPPILLLLTFIFFWPQLVLHKSLYWGDIGLYFLPMEQFLRRELLAGRVPLWNPYILCGAPYVGNPQTWPIYPSSLLLRWMPADQAINWMVALHVWLAGYGDYCFLRKALGLRIAPSLFGAIVFMFGGQLISKEQFPNMVQAIAYTPWILFALHRVMDGVFNVPASNLPQSSPAHDGVMADSIVTDDVSATTCVDGLSREEGGALPVRVAALGLALGLQLLAAHAQITMLTLYLAVAYLLQTCLSHSRMGVPARHKAGVPALHPLLNAAPRLLESLVSAVVLAAGIAAAQLLPTCELFEHAWRQRLGLSIVNRFFLPWHQLPNFVLPYLHGDPYRGNYTGRGNFWETCCYVGWLPFVCAAAGVAQCFRSDFGRKCRFWTIVFVVGVWMAMGSSGGLFRLAWAALPGFRSFHDPARCLLWASYALSVLSAYGSQAILAWTAANASHREIGGWKRRRRMIALLVIVLAFTDLSRFGRTIYPLAVSPFPGAAIGLGRAAGSVSLVASDPEIASHAARLLAPDSARIWERFTGHRSYRQGVRGYGALWRETLTPNLPMSGQILDAFGYEPVTRYDAQMILGTIAGAFGPDATDRQRATAAVLAGAYGVRYIATDRVDMPDLSVPELQTVFDEPALPALGNPGVPNGSVYVSRNLRWQPRVRLTTNVLVASSPAMAVRAVLASTEEDTGLDLGQTTVIAGPGASDIAARLAAIVSVRSDSVAQRHRPARRRPAHSLWLDRWGLLPRWQLAAPISPLSAMFSGGTLLSASRTGDTIASDVASLYDAGPDRVVVTAANARPAVLVLADTRHPGWRATVDSRPASILSADGFVRAIALPNPGRHVVIFTYRPDSFYVGLYTTLWTLCIMIALFVAARREKPAQESAARGYK